MAMARIAVSYTIYGDRNGRHPAGAGMKKPANG